MITISLCMIVKNEEDTLARCLKAVEGIADEIVIVDTGSTDRTKEIAGQFTDRIYDFAWIDDFAAARNFAFSKATKEYILWLDADDEIMEEDRSKFKSLKATLPSHIDTVMMHYHLTFDAKGKPSFSMRRNRLVRRDRGFRWIGAVHEYLEVFGNSLLSDVAITHKKERAYTDRNLRIYRRRQEAGEAFSHRDMYYFANELRDHRFFDEAAQMYEQFWACGLGWIEDRIASCHKLASCYERLGDREKQLLTLLRAFSLSAPRAETCYQIGLWFAGQQRWDEAIYWYTQATSIGSPPDNGGMRESAYWTWLPHLQLCVCYDRIGNLEEAERHNEIASTYQPDHPSMKHNRSYFESKRAAGQSD